MASSLLALIDDIATVLDDVALLSKVAAKKLSLTHLTLPTTERV
jgi:predicted DNA repair protein MutK